MSHYFLFLPHNLPKITYIEVLKSSKNNIYWSAAISQKWQIVGKNISVKSPQNDINKDILGRFWSQKSPQNDRL
jgi:hypothetical protein